MHTVAFLLFVPAMTGWEEEMYMLLKNIGDEKPENNVTVVTSGFSQSCTISLEG